MGLGPGRGGQALGCLLPRPLSLQAQGHSGDTEAPLRGQVSRFGPPSSPASAHGRAGLRWPCASALRSRSGGQCLGECRLSWVRPPRLPPPRRQSAPGAPLPQGHVPGEVHRPTKGSEHQPGGHGSPHTKREDGKAAPASRTEVPH